MRRSRSLLVTGLAVGLFVTLTAPRAQANDWDQLTYLTFSAPVEIPGVALPAGTYMFKLADTASDRQIVQVFSQDGLELYATFFTMPDQRLTPTDKPLVILDEMPAGAPEAVGAWFYPGNTIGHQFVYPKEQATRIAAATDHRALATP
jgi:hypothetical protein